MALTWVRLRSRWGDSNACPVEAVEGMMAYVLNEFCAIMPVEAPVTIMLPALENVRFGSSPADGGELGPVLTWVRTTTALLGFCC